MEILREVRSKRKDIFRRAFFVHRAARLRLIVRQAKNDRLSREINRSERSQRRSEEQRAEDTPVRNFRRSGRAGIRHARADACVENIYEKTPIPIVLSRIYLFPLVR